MNHNFLHISFLRDAQVYGFYYSEAKNCIERYPQLNQEVCFDFYSMIMIHSGHGTIIINDIRYTLNPYHFFLIPPFTRYSIQLNDTPQGSFIFFCKDFYATDFNSIHLIYLFSFFNTLKKEKAIQSIDLQKNGKDIITIIGLIADEYCKKSTINSAILRSYLNVIIQRLISLINNNRTSDENLHILDKLSSLIETHYREQRNIGFYAQQTGVTENKLNDLCTNLFENNLKQLVLERVMMEARKMLEQTNLTVAEIAYNLHFTDNSNFNKIFKAYTRITPRKYREMHKRLLP